MVLKLNKIGIKSGPLTREYVWKDKEVSITVSKYDVINVGAGVSGLKEKILTDK